MSAISPYVNASGRRAVCAPKVKGGCTVDIRGLHFRRPTVGAFILGTTMQVEQMKQEEKQVAEDVRELTLDELCQVFGGVSPGRRALAQ